MSDLSPKRGESRSSSRGQRESRNRSRNGKYRESREKSSDKSRSRSRERRPVMNSDDFTQIYVAKLDRRTREDDLREAFSKFGKLKEVALKFNYAFIDYEDHESAAAALRDMDGKTFVNGEKLIVE